MYAARVLHPNRGETKAGDWCAERCDERKKKKNKRLV